MIVGHFDQDVDWSWLLCVWFGGWCDFEFKRWSHFLSCYSKGEIEMWLFWHSFLWHSLIQLELYSLNLQ